MVSVSVSVSKIATFSLSIGIENFDFQVSVSIWKSKLPKSQSQYSRSSYCGIRPVLWHRLLLCLEVAKAKSLLIDVVETYMKVI